MKTKILEKLFYTYIYSEKALIAYLRSSFFHTLQPFINHNFSYLRFHARKTVLCSHPCTWEIVPVNEQTCTLLIIT